MTLGSRGKQDHDRKTADREGDDALTDILFALFYLVAIAVIILHFTGWLEDHNMEWLVFVMAVLVFPVVIFL